MEEPNSFEPLQDSCFDYKEPAPVIETEKIILILSYKFLIISNIFSSFEYGREQYGRVYTYK